MSITTNLINFKKDLAEDNFNNFISDSSSFSNSPKASEELKNRFDDFLMNYIGNENDLVYLEGELRMLYLLCGSLSSISINSPVGEFQHMQQITAFSKYYRLDEECEIPTKDGFLELYSKINETDLNNIAKNFSNEYDYDLIDAKSELIYTLKYLRNFVITLKNNPDSYLVICHDYNEPDVLPRNINDYILKKVNEKEDLKDIITKLVGE